MSIELRRKIVTARKQHQCSLCLARIHAGEKYERATLIHDETIYDFLTCTLCLDDNIIGYADRMFGYDDGVNDEIAYEWACEVMAYGSGRDPGEVNSAKRYLERYYAATQPLKNHGMIEPPRNSSTFGGAE